MNSNVVNIYYRLIKPILPRRIQIILRQIVAKMKLKKMKDVWPIDECAAKKPDNWPGWPGGKRFALVLTHDVERQEGVENCAQLMEIEKKYGFRSSFNFVFYDYTVPRELLEKMKYEGFEIGVHGLSHNGNMFRDRAQFNYQSLMINKYLKEFESSGFRAPSMFHNLEWIHDLNIEYDLSTFDTDPFEAQSDGVGTIFPFSVNGNPFQRGYIELPYTLPQDFTLFILLRHRNIDVWKKKLDWIAKHGGMALLIVHPDYVDFGTSKVSYERYPIDYYEQLLKYVITSYKGLFWNALPRDLSRYYENIVKRTKDI